MKITFFSQEGPVARAGKPAPAVPQLTRRSLLKGSGILMGTIATGSVLSALAPSRAWALEMQVLNQAQGEALMAMTKTLYPHERLPDAVYALAVKDLDGMAAANPATAATLRSGLEGLDKQADGAFAKASDARRLELVTALEGTPFFNLVRGKCVTSLYDNEMAYTVFGYEGSAWEKGGYITRGFQDLTWLPDPPADASPAPYMG